MLDRRLGVLHVMSDDLGYPGWLQTADVLLELDVRSRLAAECLLDLIDEAEPDARARLAGEAP